MLVEEMQSKTVRLVLSALLGVEMVERAAIVLVDVAQFDKNVPDCCVNPLGQSLPNFFKVISAGEIGFPPVSDLE
ncbi:hypothetical protein SB861_49100 [Paraburkholderia sp. SIMBA_049]